MVLQSEAMLEKSLITRLEEQGYEYIGIKNEDELNRNFKKQLEKHNKVELTEEEFGRILLHLDKGSIFKKAEILRDKYELKRTDGTLYLEFIDREDWCHNLFQVTNQITMHGKYENRYDVTILINGIPLVQIELKRRGIELKEAFNQINRYHKHSFKGLFNYVQLFVISNGVNTKYYANNRDKSFKFTFYWTDKDNKKISSLDEFADTFLEKCQLAKMITRYIVLNQSDESLMILRPYQFYAVEGILNKAINTNDNGYIWHTTGSGKTLTSFKASQLLTMDKNIDQVIFVVDRRDLDYQTTKEFNSFCNGAVDGTENTASLVKQLAGANKLVITTIQKLTRAIDNDRYEHKMNALKDKKIILIFDECHRSQFGDMHRKITDFFSNIQYFGFTGTPIFSENANKFRTTKDLFGDCLHRYLIKDAISDKNVLGFAVEYVGRYKDKNRNQPDIEVEAIDTKELMESDQRLSAIADYILNNHNAKTFNKEFTGIFAVSSIQVLNKYYELFKAKDHNLKIATIFSYGANEEDEGGDEHSRDRLERYMKDYNSMFGTNYSTDTFDEYYVDVAKRVKDKQIDILLVVNMFLTGFDSKYLNTLYVDKNLKYHGLVQAFSRTNRILNEKKKQGNIVCFRNLKDRVDEAITLYSDENALETVLMKSYKEYVEDFNHILTDMRAVVTEVRDVDDLQSEKEKLDFITRFRELLRTMTRLSTFTEFDFEDLNIDPQTFEDYRSKYLDLYEDTRKVDKISILEDVDFEIELLRRDDINVNYILNLLKDLDRKSSSFEQDRKFILESMEKNINLRSKRELVEKFIDQKLMNINSENDFDTEFEKFMEQEKKQAVYNLIELENLKQQEIQEAFEEYEFSGKLKKDTIKSSFFTKLGLKEMRKKVDFIGHQISNIVEMFTWH